MFPNRLKILNNFLKKIPQIDYPYQSRIHRLHSYDDEGVSCYIKRDDELGCGISGSKIRKYRTLLPFFLENQIQEIVVVGTAYSNHVLGISQLLIENRINASYFLRGDPKREFKGNALLSMLFIQQNKIHWISKENWKHVSIVTQEYAKAQQHRTYVLSEGAHCPEGLTGALTLPLDIIRNEIENALHFDHIFVDAGTGLTASALILAFAWLQKSTHLHVVLMAGIPEDFLKQLSELKLIFNAWLSISNLMTGNFSLHVPQLKKFGQMNQALFQFINDFAKSEGILTDPIYSAKLFLEAKKIIKEKKLSGNILIIHSGGSMTLSGFSEQLKKINLS